MKRFLFCCVVFHATTATASAQTCTPWQMANGPLVPLFDKSDYLPLRAPDKTLVVETRIAPLMAILPFTTSVEVPEPTATIIVFAFSHCYSNNIFHPPSHQMEFVMIRFSRRNLLKSFNDATGDSLRDQVRKDRRRLEVECLEDKISPTYGAAVLSVSIAPNTVMSAQQNFPCDWRVLNTGTSTWGIGALGTTAEFRAGNRMAGPTTITLSSFVSPGQSTIIHVSMISPSSVGSYSAIYRLNSPEGVDFGEPLQVSLIVGTDAARLVSQTIPPNALISPLQPFRCEWVVENVGTTVWAYGSLGTTVENIGGERMSAPSTVTLSSPVYPGQRTTIAVQMIAPLALGPHAAAYQLNNPAGFFFGEQLTVSIVVGIDEAKLISQSISTDAPMSPQQTFRCEWVLENSGTTSWSPGPDGYTLEYISGDRMSAPATVTLNTPVLPFQRASIAVQMVAPLAPGIYAATYRMNSRNGAFFGPTLRVSIVVKEDDKDTLTSLVATPLATTGGSSVQFTATVAPFPGALGTVTFLDAGVAIPGGSNIAVINGVAIFSTTTLAVGTHPVTASYSGAAGFAPSISNAQSVVISAGGSVPAVNSVTVNSGLAGFSGAQRSRVINVAVEFNQAVTLDNGALTLALHTNNVNYAGNIGGAGQPAGTALPVTFAMTPSTDNKTWTLSWSGANTDGGADGFASLKDGVYDFVVNATKVHPVGSPTVKMVNNSTTVFHRLFGDVNAPMPTGNDFSAILAGNDNLVFRGAFNKPVGGGYQPYLDFNGDGVITSADNLALRGRFNKSLTWTV